MTDCKPFLWYEDDTGDTYTNEAVAEGAAPEGLRPLYDRPKPDDTALLRQALALGVPATRINDIVRERRTITADTALRLAAFFGNSAEFWMGLQADHDMAVARATLADALGRIRRFEGTAAA